MIIIISPAKSIEMCGEVGNVAAFQSEANVIVEKIAEIPAEELQKKLKLSDKLLETALINQEKFFCDESLSSRAIFAYNGAVFKSMRAREFSSKELSFAQNHLLIASIVYGLLRPFDGIKAYRADYLMQLSGFTSNLYNFWKPLLTHYLCNQVESDDGVLINLASLDIWGAFSRDKLETRIRIIDIEFKVLRNGKLVTINTIAKQLRGLMTRYIIENELKSPELLKNFSAQDYSYNAELSSENKYVFLQK